MLQNCKVGIYIYIHIRSITFKKDKHVLRSESTPFVEGSQISISYIIVECLCIIQGILQTNAAFLQGKSYAFHEYNAYSLSLKNASEVSDILVCFHGFWQFWAQMAKRRGNQKKKSISTWHVKTFQCLVIPEPTCGSWTRYYPCRMAPLLINRFFNPGGVWDTASLIMSDLDLHVQTHGLDTNFPQTQWLHVFCNFL